MMRLRVLRLTYAILRVYNVNLGEKLIIAHFLTVFIRMKKKNKKGLIYEIPKYFHSFGPPHLIDFLQ